MLGQTKRIKQLVMSFGKANSKAAQAPGIGHTAMTRAVELVALPWWVA